MVITTDGTALRAPSEAEIAAAVGLTTDPATDFYDLIVIGGGPAGLGSAVYGASEGLRTVLVERQATGGQAGQSSRIENYLGFPDGVSGAQLTDRARRQAAKFGAEVLTARDVVGSGGARVGPRRPVRGRQRDRGALRRARHRCLVPQPGRSWRRRPDRPRRLLRLRRDGGAGLLGSGRLHRRRGANSAGQAAVFFSKHAATVSVLVRGTNLEASMSTYLIKQLDAIDNVVVRTSTEVVEACGDGHLERLVLGDRASGDKQTVEAGSMFVFIGAAPRTDWLDGVVERDARGFVLTGPDLVVEGKPPAAWRLDRDPYHLESSVPGVFVAGDVRAESVKRVASAVGEGAMAVTLVHRYLADQ